MSEACAMHACPCPWEHIFLEVAGTRLADRGRRLAMQESKACVLTKTTSSLAWLACEEGGPPLACEVISFYVSAALGQTYLESTYGKPREALQASVFILVCLGCRQASSSMRVPRAASSDGRVERNASLWLSSCIGHWHKMSVPRLASARLIDLMACQDVCY